MSLPDDREYRATNADDVHKVYDCWTRLDVLIALSGRTRPVGVVGAALGLSANLMQAHTATLTAQGLLNWAKEGKNVLYTLSERVTIRVEPRGVSIDAAADDGFRLTSFIPQGTVGMRLIGAGLWARLHDSPRPVIEVRTRGPAPAPKDRKTPPPHRSSEP